MKVTAIVGARLNSSRLPGKHLLKLASQPLIYHIHQRLSRCKNISNVVLATTSDAFNTPLVEEVSAYMGCVAFEGDVNDLMSRLNSVVTAEAPDIIVYICGDCPLIDPVFIDHAIDQLSQDTTKDTIQLHHNVQSLHEGIAVYTRQGWNTLFSASNTAMAKEHVGYANTIAPCLSTLFIGDTQDFSKIKHRISVDTSADYRFMQAVYNRWYSKNAPNTIVDLSWVQQQLLSDKGLRSINMHVHQKRPEQQYQHITLACHVSRDIGLGHVKRCAIMADAIQESLGIGTNIIIHGEAQALTWLSSGARWLESEARLFEALEASNDDLWILDFHPDFIDMPKLENLLLKHSHRKCIAIDKLTSLAPIVDQVFVPSFFCNTSASNISSGWQNMFVENQEVELKQKQILVLTGGTDALGYGSFLPEVIETSVPNEWQVVWIQGPYAPKPTLPSGSNITLKTNPPNLSFLIQESGVILTCYGLSLFEAIACSGLTVLLPTDRLANKDELKALRKEKLCHITESLNDVSTTLKDIVNGRLSTENYPNKVLTSGSGRREISKLVDSLLTNT